MFAKRKVSFRFRRFPFVAADAPLLRKLQLEQLYVGLDYLFRVDEIIRIGSYNRQFLRKNIEMASDVYRVAAELEDTPAKRLPWYEARVRKEKEFERFMEMRVQK